MQAQSNHVETKDYDRRQEKIFSMLSEAANANQPVTADGFLTALQQWDSLAALDFVMAVENQFGAEVRPDEVQSCRTAQDLVNLVMSKVGS